MLKLAWYLITDRDYWTEAAEHRQPTPVRELASALNCLFSDEAEFTPAHTATATDIMLRMAAYLCDSVRHGPATAPDRAAFDRLLHGINLLLAYMAQATSSRWLVDLLLQSHRWCSMAAPHPPVHGGRLIGGER
jgi:hypothetical protein